MKSSGYVFPKKRGGAPGRRDKRRNERITAGLQSPWSETRKHKFPNDDPFDLGTAEGQASFAESIIQRVLAIKDEARPKPSAAPILSTGESSKRTRADGYTHAGARR
jgi:hypothetical protein